jgi:hypothetical protein
MASPSQPLLPLAALIMSVLGLCFPPLLLISGALGVYLWLRSGKVDQWAARKQMTWATLAISGAGLVIFLGMGLPKFKRYQLRAQQMECREVLVKLVEAQQGLYAKEKRYTEQLAELGLSLQPGMGVVRLAGRGEVSLGVDATRSTKATTAEVDQRIPHLVRAELGIHGDCPACSVTMLCAAQVDDDPTLDIWTVSTIGRTGNAGEYIAGGIPWNETDDVAQ